MNNSTINSPIVDMHGRPLKSRSVPRRRLSSAPITKSDRQYLTEGLTPQRIGPIFRKADRGDVSSQAQLFEQLIEKDSHVMAENAKRINSISSQYLDWQFTPASDSQRDLDVVNFLELYVTGCPGWTRYKKAQQSAVGHGFSAIEPIWDVSEGQAVVKDFDLIEHKRITFTDPQTGFLSDHPYLITDDNPSGEIVHPLSIFLHKTGGLSGHAARVGVFRPVTWMVVFKHFAIKDWWVFSELCGIPLRIGYYDSSVAGDEEALRTLENALKGIGVDMYALISRGTEIEFKEASNRVNGADIWREQAAFTNNEISKALVGSAAFSEAGKSGSYALHTLETGVRADLTLSDAQETAAADVSSWISALVGLNFGWDTKLPRFEAVFKKQEDQKAKSEWLEPLVDRIPGQVPLQWYKKMYGVPELQPDDRTVAEAASGAAVSSAKQQIIARDNRPAAQQDFGQDDIDRLAGAAVRNVDLRKNEEAVLSLIKRSSSYEEVFAGLAELYDFLDFTSMEKTMREALIMAQAAGIKVVQDG